MSVSHTILGASSTASSMTDSRRELMASGFYFKWESMKELVGLLMTFATSNMNFDIFSGIASDVSVLHFLFFSFIIGVPYMYMDIFIKLYTGKYDLNENLNPLLKAVNYGMILQTFVWIVLNATNLMEAVMFFITLCTGSPTWNQCTIAETDINETCVASGELFSKCKETTKKVSIYDSSMHLYYREMYIIEDKAVISRKLFMLCLVWCCIFFACTLSELILTKIFKIFAMIQMFSTVFVTVLVMMLKPDVLKASMSEVFTMADISIDVDDVMYSVTYLYNIGLVGVYDFGMLSPFTVIDNAIIFFTILYTILAILRSIFVNAIYTIASQCAKIPPRLDYHYTIYALLPQACNMFFFQRLIMFYFYLYVIMSLFPNIIAFLYSCSKTLHSEYQGVENIYVIGIMCFLGFLATILIHIPVGKTLILTLIFHNLNTGLLYTQALLGFFKVSIIMYLYGVDRFATDISFWLGEQPSALWIMCWSLLPVFLFIYIFRVILHLIDDEILDIYSLKSQLDVPEMDIVWRLWLLFSFILVIFITFRTIGKYVAANKLGAILKASKKYGPPDSEERKKRKKFNQAQNIQECPHECITVEDALDCNHGKLIYGLGGIKSDASILTVSSDVSMMRIFESRSRSRLSEMMDIGSTMQLR